MLITWPPSFANCGKAWKTLLSVPAYMKTQMPLHDLGLNRKAKKEYSKSSRKLARQGSFHSTTLVSALYEDLPAVLLTLCSLPESNSIVYSLLRNIHSRKLIATL